MKIAILGAGMAGFGAAHRLFGEGIPSTIYEAKPFHGGHTASFVHSSGFIFDDGPHISFTKNERIQKLFAESVNHEYEVIRARCNNYWKGYWIKHPAQCNLYGLPADLVVNVLRDFIAAHYDNRNTLSTYEEWLLANYGKAFAETFPMVYGLKYHTTTAANMSTDWLGTRIYRPCIEEVLRGALSPATPDVHYISHFRYPSRNGFVSFLNLFLNQTDVQLGHKLIRIDPRAKHLHFSNGSIVPYDHVISSIPLPDLLPMIAGIPADVLEAGQKLAWTTCVIVNIGLDRQDISDAHWTYFYDQDVFFTRVSFPHMSSPHNVPAGAGSIQTESYYSQKYRPLDRAPEECIDPVITDLRRCGLIREDDRILFQQATVVRYGNVIFDHERAAALKTVHGYLDDVGILCCGRYGEWGYHWTDEAFISGENAAQKCLDRLCSPSLSLQT